MVKEKKLSELEESRAKVVELTDSLQRLQADFENYRKYMDKEKSRWSGTAIHRFVREMLPTLDAVESAVKNASVAERKGVEMLHNQFMSVLKSHGLELIECVGRQVDPAFHEVLLQENGTCEDGEIIEEMQKGYTIGGDVIRTSKVKVCRNEQNFEKSKTKSGVINDKNEEGESKL
jgi:molecular chaperone GrpE